MADILKKDPVVYQRERESFIRDLKHFHEARGTPIRRLPCVNGKDFDVYLLYVLVTSRGGWVKVNQRNEWSSVVDQFNSFNRCVNGEVALKQIYLSYLDRYEKIHFLGETCDRGTEDDEDSRHKRFSSRSTMQHHQPIVPHQYNYHQHIVPENIRANGKLSQNLYNPSEYDKLALSLISPLPNEQDFAINVCALLSGSNNEGKNTTLKLCNHPRLLHYLLAHAAVYNHHALRSLMEENYKEVRGYSLKYFWSDVLEDKELSILMDEKKHVKRHLKRLPAGPSYSSLTAAENDDSDSPLSEGDSNQKYGDEEVAYRLKLEDDDKELFCVGRSYGTQDFVGQRVLQVAMILRNATFIEENVPTLAHDLTFLRFVLMCCGARWNCLHQLGFDMLSNIAHEIAFEDCMVEHILRVVCQGLESQDRTVILACVETLNKLGQKEENEDAMLRFIEQKIYDRICSFLSLQDIMLLIHTLECLYSLSSLGEKACNSIVHVSGAIDSLISLITVEAQSYGPKACILMRVVETVTGDSQDIEQPTSLLSAAVINHSVSSASNIASTANVSAAGPFALTSSMTPPHATIVSSAGATSCLPASSASAATVSSLLQSTPIATPAVAAPVVTPVTKVPSTHRVLLPAANSLTSSAVAAVNAVTTIAPVASATTVTQPSVVAVTQQENENFASQWLKNTFETHTQPGRGIEQGEMYKMYLTACSRAGRRGVIAPLHFPQCVRSVFGVNVGPRQMLPASATGATDTNTSKLVVYEGLQVRAKPLNVTVTSSAPTQPVRTPSSPILKAQLSGPSSPQISKKEVKSKVSSSHPHLSNVLLNAGSAQTTVQQLKSALPTQTPVAVISSTTSTVNDSSNNTSLIKSLLASKVGADFVNPKTSTNVKNDKSVSTGPHQLVLNTAVAAQVTQRQQQQQLQQHKIVSQSQISGIVAAGETSNLHILPQHAGDLQQKHLVQITQPGSQPQLVQVIQSQEQKSIIQLAQGQQLLQMNANADKPQLVQISHPGGQQQLIQITPSGQQQLLQVCQSTSQSNQPPQIIQLCSVKQEQPVQTSDNLTPQPVVLSSQSGQTQQVIMTPALQQQLLSQIPQSVQQQLLQGAQPRAMLSQQIIPDQTATVTQQSVPITTNESGQQYALVSQSQLRQLMQEQTKIVQQTPTILPQLTTSTVHVNAATQVKQEPRASSPAVSVITSTASAISKPYQARINGVRNFTPVNIIIDDTKDGMNTELTTDEKMMNSPDFPSPSNSSDSSDLLKQAIQNQTSKYIVENHTASSVVGSNTLSANPVNSSNNNNNNNNNNRVIKSNDLESELSESSSNHSLPVISIKDTETNLPSCEVTNEDSTGMFEDFLMNGKSNNAVEGAAPNNVMNDDSLLNDILMTSDFVPSVPAENATVPKNSVTVDFTSSVDSNGTVSSTIEQTLSTTNDVKVEVDAVGKRDSGTQVSSSETQTQITTVDDNLPNLVKNESKLEDKVVKNMMLAELLEKNSEKKEAPILNGALRLGEKGLELISKDEMHKTFSPAVNEKSVICTNKKLNIFPNVTTTANQKVTLTTKRTNDQEVQCDNDPKKPRLNGDTKMMMNDDDVNDECNVKASSSAANLYAALAADVLGDIDGMEDEEVPSPTPNLAIAPATSTYQTTVTPNTQTIVESTASQQLYLAGPNPRQILVASSSSGLPQRVAIMGAGGQPYFVTPQTAIVQGQPQTVLVTQTAQQHGTGAKTIIILQSQNAPPLTSQSVVTNASQQKVIIQKMAGTPAPVMSVSSAPMIASTSLPVTTIKSAQPAKLVQTQTIVNAQPSQQVTQQFVSVQSMTSASAQTTLSTANSFTTGYCLSSTMPTQTSTMVSTQCIVPSTAQTTVLSQMPQVTPVNTLVTPASSITTAITTNVQAQAATQSINSRQVKVIKTIPHLQSVISPKPTTPIQPHQTTVQSQQQLINQAPSTTAVASVTPQVQTVNMPAVMTTAAATTLAPTISAVAVTTIATTVTTSATNVTSVVKTAEQGQYVCEWRSCMRSFKTANEVYLHACAAHCPSDSQEIQCLWERCDAMKRKRFSLMTHLYDRHCNPEILKMMAVRRKQISQSGRSEIPPPLPPPPHPGYAPNAALHAIKRHALEFVNPKELQDDNEGPVTKSIRLTSSLILRNVVIYSTVGRRHVRGYEPHLASVALSNVESSRTIAQILYDMNDHNR